MTPAEFRAKTLGKSYNVDGAHGFQCWDYYAYFLQLLNVAVSAYCALTGYVCDLWRLKDKYGYSAYFEYIYKAEDLRPGDWVIWDRGSSHPKSHIAMYMLKDGKPVALGQNQGAPYVNEKATTWDILGALRFKGWGTLKRGASDIEINGHKYAMYRQQAGQKPVILSAGLNKLAGIRQLDADAYIYAKACGAHFFQAREDVPGQEKGMTFGDISAPLNDVWRELPNQNSTLFYDLETGLFGDCTGVHIDPTHNVFSPAVVFPASGNYQYARMVGIDHVNTVSRYTFIIRFTNGEYACGLAMQDMTPKGIADDFKTYCAGELENIAFLDGGGSAQYGRWVE